MHVYELKSLKESSQQGVRMEENRHDGGVAQRNYVDVKKYKACIYARGVRIHYNKELGCRQTDRQTDRRAGSQTDSGMIFCSAVVFL